MSRLIKRLNDRQNVTKTSEANPCKRMMWEEPVAPMTGLHLDTSSLAPTSDDVLFEDENLMVAGKVPDEPSFRLRVRILPDALCATDEILLRIVLRYADDFHLASEWP